MSIMSKKQHFNFNFIICVPISAIKDTQIRCDPITLRSLQSNEDRRLHKWTNQFLNLLQVSNIR